MAAVHIIYENTFHNMQILLQDIFEGFFYINISPLVFSILHHVFRVCTPWTIKQLFIHVQLYIRYVRGNISIYFTQLYQFHAVFRISSFCHWSRFVISPVSVRTHGLKFPWRTAHFPVKFVFYKSQFAN